MGFIKGLVASKSWPVREICESQKRRELHREYYREMKRDNPDAKILIFWPEGMEEI